MSIASGGIAGDSQYQIQIANKGRNKSVIAGLAAEAAVASAAALQGALSKGSELIQKVVDSRPEFGLVGSNKPSEGGQVDALNQGMTVPKATTGTAVNVPPDPTP